MSIYLNDGGSIRIGAPAIGGTPGSVLFIDASGNLGEHNPEFTYDGAGTLGVPYIQLDITAGSPPHAEGLFHWNADDGTAELGMPGGNVNLQIGQEILIRGKAIGSDVPNGAIVYVSGAAGNKPTFTLAKADSRATSDATVAMATEAISQNANGYVTTFGYVRGVAVPPATFAAGDVLYLSPTTAGEFTNVKPTSPNFAIVIGYVMASHVTEGLVFFNLDKLSNIYTDITGMTSGSIPFADSNGFLSEDNANLFWDNVNNRFGIGTATPGEKLEVAGSAKIFAGHKIIYDGA